MSPAPKNPDEPNWHARPEHGVLKSVADKELVIWFPRSGAISELEAKATKRPRDGYYAVKIPVTRIINMVSSEPDKLFSAPKETYYFNSVNRVLESSVHRDAYLLGAAPDKDIEECKRICEHYKKDWETVSGTERVWAYRLLQYIREQEIRRARDREGLKVIALLGGIVWLASVAPSVPAIASPAAAADTKNKEITVTVRKTASPANAKVHWTQYELSDAVNLSQWSNAAKDADGNYFFKCNPKLPLWVKVNDGKAKRIDLPDRDTVIERLP